MARTLSFYKYEGSGNDFILINNMDKGYELELSAVRHLCSRHFGIGSDGLILIEPHPSADFKMVFYNPDGSMSFCGNGSRCAVQFASDQGVIKTQCNFEAIDGMHSGTLAKAGRVRIHMRDVDGYKTFSSDEYYLHTGSPHHLLFVKDLNIPDFEKQARAIRYHEQYAPGGSNINYIKKTGESQISMRTYERGVESETLSCGTGVTAAALGLSIHQNRQDGDHKIQVQTKGGDLEVDFHRQGDYFRNIYLGGPVKKVFKGEVIL